MIRRLIAYRLALCSIALNHNADAELYFKDALPSVSTNSAPKDIYIKYARFLAKCGKFASAGLAVNSSAEWNAKHKEYLDWYYARTGPGSRCRLIDMYTERDYNLVNTIKQNSAIKPGSATKQSVRQNKAL